MTFFVGEFVYAFVLGINIEGKLCPDNEIIHFDGGMVDYVCAFYYFFVFRHTLI